MVCWGGSVSFVLFFFFVGNYNFFAQPKLIVVQTVVLNTPNDSYLNVS